MGMLELVVRFRLGRNGDFHTSSSLVTHNIVYIYIYIQYYIAFSLLLFCNYEGKKNKIEVILY
jgi:hypothetical protein